jgi:hypothetical protein
MHICTEPSAIYTEAVLTTQRLFLNSNIEMSPAVLSDVIFAYCFYFYVYILLA